MGGELRTVGLGLVCGKFLAAAADPPGLCCAALGGDACTAAVGDACTAGLRPRSSRRGVMEPALRLVSLGVPGFRDAFAAGLALARRRSAESATRRFSIVRRPLWYSMVSTPSAAAVIWPPHHTPADLENTSHRSPIFQESAWGRTGAQAAC